MHTKVSIYWDDDDPFPMGKRFNEAFSQVINFCPELLSKEEKKERRPQELTSFNRVIGGDFDMDDLVTLTAYSAVVHTRIMTKYAGKTDDVSEGILRAAKNMVDVVMATVTYIRQNLR